MLLVFRSMPLTAFNHAPLFCLSFFQKMDFQSGTELRKTL
jgi:hypothetical protein